MLNSFPDTTAYQTGIPAGTPDAHTRRGPSLFVLCALMVLALFILLLGIREALASETLQANDRSIGTPARGEAAMDMHALQEIAEVMLKTEAASLGEPKVTVHAPDHRPDLPWCAQPEAFLPPGAKAQGRTTVGVRCAAPTRWTVYLQAQVQILGNYLVAARPLAPGQELKAADLVLKTGDLAELQQGALTDPGSLIGRQLLTAVNAGQPVRGDLLKPLPVVLLGQIVHLRVLGRGFEVTGEGTAVTTGTAGQSVQVRTARGNLVSGIARTGGVVELRI